jgi:hypothetical protein
VYSLFAKFPDIKKEVRRFNCGLPFLLICFLLSLMFSRGFGIQFIFKVVVLLLFGFLLWHRWTIGNISSLIKVAFCFVAACLFWPIVFLYGFWSFVIGESSDDHKLHWQAGTSAILFFWLLQNTTIGSWTYFPFIGMPIFLITCFILFFLPRQVQTGLIIACMIFSIFQLYNIRSDAQIGYNQLYAPGYRQGAVLSKILNGTLVDINNVGGKVGITSLIQKSKVNNSQYPIILVEHDQKPSKDYPIIIESSVTMPYPWYANQLFGDQYLLAAIAEDGQWISNIGGKLSPKGHFVLITKTRQGYQPLIIKYGKKVYINDSDPFVDRLANYQQSAIREIAYGLPFYRSLNILSLVGLLLSRWKKTNIIISCIILVIILVYVNRPIQGNVRMVGDVSFPHEPSKISGLMRSIVDAGFAYTTGTENCTLLVVGESKKAAIKSTELMVVGSAGATITLGENVIKIDELPLGDEDGVIDARNVIINGVLNKPSVKFQNITILGTGSPAKQNWSIWLR